MKIMTSLLLIFAIAFANAQTLDTRKIAIRKNNLADKLSDITYKFTTGQDDQNYYMVYSPSYWMEKGLYFAQNTDPKLAIVNKELTTVKNVDLAIEKGDTYRSTCYTTDHIGVIYDNYDKKNKEMNIILKRYSKTTGAYQGVTTLAKVKTPSWNPWYYASQSPDGKKYGVVFLAEKENGKKSTFDEIHAFVLNQDSEIIWERTENLRVSNEEFLLWKIATTDEGNIFIIFTSEPKNRRSGNPMTYLDVTFLGENDYDQIAIPLDNRNLADVSGKALQNGNLFFATLFSETKESHPTHLQTAMFDAEKFTVTNNTISAIPRMETKSKITSIMGGLIPSRYDYGMSIQGIEELDNGEIATVCEQNVKIIYTANNRQMPFYVKGAILTAFANKDGVVENYNVYNKFQQGNMRKYITIGTFAMGNQICYLFNENTKNVTGKTKDAVFNGNDSRNSVIVCNKISNGTPAQSLFLTDKAGKSGKCYQNILLKDGNKLLIITGNGKTMDLETIKIEE